MNEYIQKYGDNAIQAYKKSLRMSESLQKDDSSPIKQDMHLLPKKSLSKKSLKSKKSQSQTRLNHSKSIRNVSKIDDDCRKKAASFIEGSKKLLTPTVSGGNMFQTFNKLNLNQGKKKLTITQTVTPKSNSKLQFNLNLNRPQQQGYSTKGHQVIIRDKTTQRIERSSSKKKHNIDRYPTSQNKYIRSYLGQVQTRLSQVLLSTKKGLKQIVSGIRESMQLILSSEQDIKLRKVFLLIKQLIQRLISTSQRYKSKYHRANQRINSLEMIHKTYISSDIQQQHGSTKCTSEMNSLKSSGKKSTQIETIILNQNYQLRKKINKLEKELDYYSSQSASLMNVFGRFQECEGMLRESKRVSFEKIKSPEGGRVGMSGSKLEKRRSSENLFYHSPNGNQMLHGGEKRLSFDPGLISSISNNNEIKQRQQANLYSSVGSSISNNNQPMSSGYKQQHYAINPYRPPNNSNLQQLSQQEDSDNEE